ncbi:DNA recombination protein RecN [Micromonospora zamorensis]|uniref:DNA recombination protein RecN n=1 Tax=Micromonospora zamorensis TaxID=709883 RepID=UPI0012FD4DA6|nr:DNA recombination protein RecN [Micromonospora zamorensis]
MVDFIRYCLGDNEHPQHPEILGFVRSALLETLLSGQFHCIERAAVGPPSKFASIWQASLGTLGAAPEVRVPVDPPSDPTGLSQRLLAACGMDNIALPEAPTKQESASQMLSIRDVFRLICLPNDRLDNKNLVFEHSHHMARQKFYQTIDVLFDIHDVAGADLAARARRAGEAATQADKLAKSLSAVIHQEHPLGPLVLESDRDRARARATTLAQQLANLDSEQSARDESITGLRRSLAEAQDVAASAAIRVRDRESLMERLSSLRGQYADDKKKLTFLKEAERLFDPLHVSSCPACLSPLKEAPRIVEGECSLCGHELPAEDGRLTLGSVIASNEAAERSSEDLDPTAIHDAVTANPDDSAGVDAMKVLDGELRATTRRLNELNDYWARLDRDLQILRAERIAADRAVEIAASHVNRVTEVPAPYLAARDAIAAEHANTLLKLQESEAGLRLWERVRQAEAVAERLAVQASRLRSEQREASVRPDRTAVYSKLSQRFGEILSDFGYPKLRDPYLNERLVPFVRGLPYTSASSGGLVLISLAWYLALWEVSFETSSHAPGLLVIDSPQKNLGHSANTDDSDFADSRLVENFYRHAKNWLSDAGRGAQLVVVDNSPPDTVAEDVVVRYTRDRNVPPYGLIDDAVD